MFDNLLHQNVSSLLICDIKNAKLPPSMLFTGPASSGKLTCALELARILGCTGQTVNKDGKILPKGHWNCICNSCLQHKALVNNNLILCGPRDCYQEIAAASYAFLRAYYNKTSYLTASRYFFLRAVRKLTMRFNQILLLGDDKISKIATLVSEIEEQLELIDFSHDLPDDNEIIDKANKKILETCQKFEDSFLYDSIPIAQVRNISAWARMKSVTGKKTVIIENADRMSESVRNALLKILEEPPEDTIFILTTTRKSAILQTILSRVRCYNFVQRTIEQEKDVITRVFHKDEFDGSIDEYLLTFLPVSSENIKISARNFYSSIAYYKIPDIPALIKECKNFEPRIALKIFFIELLNIQKPLLKNIQGSYALKQISEILQNSWNNVTVYNQNLQSAFEMLIRDIFKINRNYGNILQCVIM